MIGNLIEMAGGKRDNPEYAQVSGYIPKDLALRFKVTCTARELTLSEGLEQALLQWLESLEEQEETEETRERSS